MNIYSDQLLVRFDAERRSLVIEHPNPRGVINPVIEIALDTLTSMNFQEASQFVGERLILLMPGIRPHFSKDFKD